MKKILAYLWPIVLRALMMTLERQIQETLYGKPKSGTTRQYGKYDAPLRPFTPTTPETVEIGYALRPNPKKPKAPFNDEVTWYFDSKDEADEVLARLTQEIREYNSAGVQDLYDLLDMSRNVTYADTQWGWIDLDEVNTVQEEGSDRWYITLPRPRYLGHA